MISQHLIYKAKDIAKHSDPEEQKRQFFEEASELIVAINHDIRHKEGRPEVLEEMADVMIMLIQLMEIYDVHEAELNAVMGIKIMRQIKRLQEAGRWYGNDETSQLG